jgi:hypothetical protein
LKIIESLLVFVPVFVQVTLGLVFNFFVFFLDFTAIFLSQIFSQNFLENSQKNLLKISALFSSASSRPKLNCSGKNLHVFIKEQKRIKKWIFQ